MVDRLSRLLLLVAVLLSSSRAFAATPCDDCCQLPCVEAEIRLATKMQQWYRSQTTAPKMKFEEYEAAEKAKGKELAEERAKDVGGLPSCWWHLPDPKTDTIAVRQWSSVGWGISAGKDGIDYTFSLKTNRETCELNEAQVRLTRDITPCSGMADATEKHERFHVTSCIARKAEEEKKGKGGKKSEKETIVDVARDEIAAYDVELKELNLLREALRKKCAIKSCKNDDANAASERLSKELDDLKKQVTLRGGKKK